MGDLYMEQKKYQQAEEYYKRAEENRSLLALMKQSELYKKQGKYKEAKEYKKLAKNKGYIQGDYFYLTIEE